MYWVVMMIKYLILVYVQNNHMALFLKVTIKKNISLAKPKAYLVN